MFKKGNLTDFEKLLFAQDHIKKLKVEIGKLQSEVEELKHTLKQDKPENVSFRKYKEQIRELKAKSKKFERLYRFTNAELILIKHKYES